MSVFHRKSDWCVAHPSPTFPDVRIKKILNDDKSEVITFEEFDNSSYQESLGSSEMWDLKNLLSSGINPNFNIHTSGSTRLDGVNDLNAFKVALSSINEESATPEIPETPEND